MPETTPEQEIDTKLRTALALIRECQDIAERHRYLNDRLKVVLEDSANCIIDSTWHLPDADTRDSFGSGMPDGVSEP